MKRSMSRSVAVIACAVAMLASSCSAFRGKPDVDVQAVPVKLVFGAKVPSPSPQPDFEVPEPTLPPIDIAPPIEDPPPPNKCDEDPYQQGCPGFILCPPGNPLNSAPESPTEVFPGKNLPVKGKYLYAHFGNYSGQPEELVITENEISEMTDEGTGYNYRFTNNYNGIVMRFEVHPSPPPDNEQSAASTENPGLFLRSIVIPPKDLETVGHNYIFGPTNPVKLLSFPINAGDIIDDAQQEFSNKRIVAQDDTAGTVYAPSSNTLRSHVEVGTAESVEVCSEYANAWKVTWTLTISGDFQGTLTGTFWFSTATGGYPVRDSYVISNAPELIEGNFSENLMRLDPTGFI